MDTWLALLLPLVYLLKLLKDLVAQLVHLRWWHLLGDGDGRWCPAHKGRLPHAPLQRRSGSR